MPKIKKITPALKGVFLIFRAPFRVWGIPKNQTEPILNSFLLFTCLMMAGINSKL